MPLSRRELSLGLVGLCMILAVLPALLAEPVRAQGSPALTVQLGHTGEVNSINYSPDGRMIVTSGAEAILWHAPSRREIRRFPISRLTGNQKQEDRYQSKTPVYFSADGRALLTLNL